MNAPRTKGLICTFLFLFLYGSLSPANAETVSIATTSTGGLMYAIGSSAAKVVADHSKIRVEVKPFGGSSTYIPLIDSGEVGMGVITSEDIGLAYWGPEGMKIGGRNPYEKSPNVRLIMRGARIISGVFVRKDSDIKSVADLKGRKVTGKYPAQQSIWFSFYAALASCGLTWKDVKVVPVPNFAKGFDALVQGRAEACLGVPGVAKMREAHAAVGLRLISICVGPEATKRFKESAPGFYPIRVKGGRLPGVEEDTWAINKDIYLAGNKNIADSTVGEILRCLWDYNKEMAPLHPILRSWTTDRAVYPDVTIPYHPGAIKFYKSKGVWKEEMDKRQMELLKGGS